MQVIAAEGCAAHIHERHHAVVFQKADEFFQRMSAVAYRKQSHTLNFSRTRRRNKARRLRRVGAVALALCDIQNSKVRIITSRREVTSSFISIVTPPTPPPRCQWFPIYPSGQADVKLQLGLPDASRLLGIRTSGVTSLAFSDGSGLLSCWLLLSFCTHTIPVSGLNCSPGLSGHVLSPVVSFPLLTCRTVFQQRALRAIHFLRLAILPTQQDHPDV